jgi:hypothetical protein
MSSIRGSRRGSSSIIFPRWSRPGRRRARHTVEAALAGHPLSRQTVACAPPPSPSPPATACENHARRRQSSFAVPGCRDRAAPIFRDGCAKHMDVAKTKIRRYREGAARRQSRQTRQVRQAPSEAFRERARGQIAEARAQGRGEQAEARDQGEGARAPRRQGQGRRSPRRARGRGEHQGQGRATRALPKGAPRPRAHATGPCSGARLARRTRGSAPNLGAFRGRGRPRRRGAR